MLKCLLFGHNWELVTTQTWVGVEPKHYGNYIERDYTREIYRCEKCGLWKSKLFVEHIFRETQIYTECPIPKEELKTAKTVIQ